MPENKKEVKEYSTSVWVFWILVAIVGTGLLFTGLQNTFTLGNLTMSVMFIVIGLILLFLSLTIVLGRANIAANGQDKVKKDSKK
jgi:uncharacterized membrane protein